MASRQKYKLEADDGDDGDERTRSCAITRHRRPVSEMLRFVADPSGRIMPDVAGKLPGRGVWIEAKAATIAKAVTTRAFARSLKRPVEAPAELPELVEAQLRQRTLAAFSIANKAGELVFGAVAVDDPGAITPGAGQTEYWDLAASSARGSGSTEAGAATVTTSYSFATTAWAVAGVSIKPVTAGITVSPTSGLTTTEAGGTATFTVVLDTAPTANVTIGLSSSDTTEGTVSPSSLTFTTGNWSTPQTVTVTGVDDAAKDGDIAYSVVTAAATSSDTNYSGLNASDVAVTTTDDEVAQTVQSGTATIGGGSASTTATITAVAMGRAFLVFSTTLNDSNPLNTEVRGEITDPTTVTFTRFGTTGAVTIKWSVVEYASGVTVQRGTTASLTSASNSIPIASVNTAKAFPIISYSQDGTTHAGNDFYKAKLTSSTNLDVSVAVTGTAIVSWQVVEFANATVQSGDVSFAVGDASKTATVTSVNTSKSWLVYTHTSDDGTTTNIGQKLVRGQITNATTLTFDRVSTGQAINLTWYLIEFTDNHVVQKGSQAFTTSETQKDVTIASAATASSFAVGGSLLQEGRSAYTADDNPGVGWMTHELTSPTKPAHYARPDGQHDRRHGLVRCDHSHTGNHGNPDVWADDNRGRRDGDLHGGVDVPADGQRGDRAEFERHDGRDGFTGVGDLHVGQLEHAADGNNHRSG